MCPTLYGTFLVRTGDPMLTLANLDVHLPSQSIFSPISRNSTEPTVYVCLSGSIWHGSYFCIDIYIARKSHNSIITTGRVFHLPSGSVCSSADFLSFFFFFVVVVLLMTFSYDIQTSSCLKPPDSFMLCVCHHKQKPFDSAVKGHRSFYLEGGGGGLEAKIAFFTEYFSVFVLRRSRGIHSGFTEVYQMKL